MTDVASPWDVTDVDVANLWTYLLGGQVITDVRDSGGRQTPMGGPGILRRLTQQFAGDPVGTFKLVAVGATAVGLAPPDAAMSALLSVEGGDVRFRDDGTAPTAAVGVRIAAGTVLAVRGKGSLTGIQFIAVAAAATVNVTFYT